MPHQLMAMTSQPLTMMIWCEPMMIWKKILVLTHMQNPPQMLMKAMLLLDDTSPYISHPVFPSVEPSSPSKNNSGFTFLPSNSFPSNVEDLCLLELAKLVHHLLLSVKYWLRQAIGKWRVTLSGLQTFLHMLHMWNHCQKDWNSTVSGTK